jgi:hypothetical protein
MPSKTATAVVGVIAGIAAIFSIALISARYSTRNTEADLRLQFQAKIDRCKLAHDEMKKSVQEIGNVADTYMAGFDSMYTHIVGSRYSSKDGSLMKWIQESNPQFDNKLYVKLADKIDVERRSFRAAQEEARDVKREHDLLFARVPSIWFLGCLDTLKMTLVTSTATNKAFDTGIDDDTYGEERMRRSSK